MSRIIVVGGSGRTGLLIVGALKKAGHSPVATIRSAHHTAALVKLGAETALLDLQASSLQDWTRTLKGADAVIFAAGSSTGESSAIDRIGVRRTLSAGEAAGVSRYIAISSIGASTGMKLEGDWATPEMRDYYKQKRAAGALIRASSLNWTILEPGELTDGRGSGKVALSEAAIAQKSIARADVAAVAVAALDAPNSIGKALQLTSGKAAIADALKALGK